ncbi:FadR family transcriptional regulator [Alicyclobacillus fastidiosus]|uniref:FadR family transcriptional regulator n=1 Tax=Alicyclobacillus fastidiosus TaxID=392011 RepID=A0ABY6ZNA7_9BACL|nr:FadR/GntR family transcriptional regulator [Alicyclobacillus fastidiosus]WAH44322.1 FadR family transcriptional regulator [Alicyclobacillus fastidiosus]GMA60649.1 GntR family transcriptional regulator [Alicyclobacillus fastidiosus]
MGLGPVQQAKTYELVIGRLKQAILDGTFAPGSRLPSVKSLSQTLGVGQAAVREAISALRASNLVEVRHGHGTFVSPLDADNLTHSIERLELMSNYDVQALLELRISVETGACRYAARRRQEHHLERLSQILSRMESDLGSAQLGEKADWDFHYAIAKASHNRYMQIMMDTIADKIQSALLSSRLALYQIPGEGKRLFEQHKAIFEAIEKRDEEVAATAMQLHLQHVFNQLSGGDGP